jgi:hypothetical protein
LRRSGQLTAESFERVLSLFQRLSSPPRAGDHNLFGCARVLLAFPGAVVAPHFAVVCAAVCGDFLEDVHRPLLKAAGRLPDAVVLNALNTAGYLSMLQGATNRAMSYALPFFAHTLRLIAPANERVRAYCAHLANAYESRDEFAPAMLAVVEPLLPEMGITRVLLLCGAAIAWFSKLRDGFEAFARLLDGLAKALAIALAKCDRGFALDALGRVEAEFGRLAAAIAKCEREFVLDALAALLAVLARNSDGFRNALDRSLLLQSPNSAVVFLAIAASDAEVRAFVQKAFIAGKLPAQREIFERLARCALRSDDAAEWAGQMLAKFVQGEMDEQAEPLLRAFFEKYGETETARGIVDGIVRKMAEGEAKRAVQLLEVIVQSGQAERVRRAIVDRAFSSVEIERLRIAAPEGEAIFEESIP